MKKFILSILISCISILSYGMTNDEKTQLKKEAYDNLKEKNYGKALEEFGKLEKEKDYDAITELGAMYQLGLGVEKDYNKAMDYYIRAYQYNANALLNMSIMYRDGLGIEKNNKIAFIGFLILDRTQYGSNELSLKNSMLLKNEVETISKNDYEEALCYNIAYYYHFIENKGKVKKTSKDLRVDIKLLTPKEKVFYTRIKNLDDWWSKGDIHPYICPDNT
jgi:hypothetical protein